MNSSEHDFGRRELLAAQAAAQRERAASCIRDCRMRWAIALRTLMLAKLAVSPMVLALVLPRASGQLSGSRLRIWVLPLILQAGRRLMKRRFSRKI